MGRKLKKYLNRQLLEACVVPACVCVSVGDNCSDKETGGEATGRREQFIDVISA